MVKPKYNPTTKKWDIQIRYKDTFGQSRNTTKRGFDTSREAKEYATNFIVSLSKKPTALFRDVVIDYYEYNKVHKKDSTCDTQYNIINNHILTTFGTQKIGDINYDMILEWQSLISQKQLAPTYMYEINCVLESIFVFAQRAYHLANNPVKNIKKIGTAKNPHNDYWTVDDFTKFINALSDSEANKKAQIRRKIPNEPYIMAYHLLFYLGLRKGELLALKKADINLETKELTINHTYRRHNKIDYNTSPKTAASKRVLPIPSRLCTMLSIYMSNLDNLQPNDRIFYMLTKDSLRRAMISSAKIAGIKIIRLHDLRHSTASLLFANKVEANVAAKILGHSSIKTTLDIYTHFNNNKVNEAITKIDNLI